MRTCQYLWGSEVVGRRVPPPPGPPGPPVTHMPRSHNAPALLRLVVEHGRRAVEDLADSVPRVILDHGESILLRVGLNHLADLPVGHAGAADGDGPVEAFAGHADELLVGCFAFARGREGVRAGRGDGAVRGVERRGQYPLWPNHPRGVEVPVVALMVQRHIDVDHVPLHQRPPIGDPVADDLVQGGAHALRVAVVPQRRGVAVPRERAAEDDLVDGVGGNARADGVPREAEDLAGQGGGEAHARDVRGGVGADVAGAHELQRGGVGVRSESVSYGRPAERATPGGSWHAHPTRTPRSSASPPRARSWAAQCSKGRACSC